jgi:putative Holliday junction resolvase
VRVLGVDYGDRRIGLALSDASASLARPWKAIPRVGNPAQVARLLFDEVKSLERDDEPVAAVVIGHPRRLGGEATHQTSAVEQIAASLRTIIDVPVVLQDERLSSREADALLARTEKDWRKRKAHVDAMAAAVILQDYLDSRARPDAQPPEDIDT